MALKSPKHLGFNQLGTPRYSFSDVTGTKPKTPSPTNRSAPPRTASFQATGRDDMASVTVRKSDQSQKAGIKVVQKTDGVYITSISEGGLLDNTQIEAGDKILSINGKRLRRGESSRDFMKLIAISRDKVTLVVKKSGTNKEQKYQSPNKKKHAMKIVEKEKLINSDGSFDYNVNPKLDSFQKATKADDDGKQQLLIKAKKLFRDQEGGLMFKKKKNNMLFVTGIALDSIFKDTQVEVGDRVASIQDVNFMSYADAAYARKLLQRAKGEELRIVVEKGWGSMFDKNKDIDPNHDKPSKQEPSKQEASRNIESTSRQNENKNGKNNPSGDVVTKILGKLETEQKSLSERQSLRKRQSRNKQDAEQKVDEESKQRPSFTTKKPSDSRQRAFSTGLRFQQFCGDFVCVAIKKNSEIDSGIKIKKQEGKFILSKLPEHEKRIPVGTQIFAINGNSEFQSVSKAKDIIDSTRGHVVFFINFDGLVAFHQEDLVPAEGQ